MDFKQIERLFMKKHTTRYTYAEYNTYQIKWAFENFDQLLLKPTFQASINLNLDFQMDRNLITKLDDKIDELRDFFHSVSRSLQKYLMEVKDEKFIEKTYQDFLNNFYKGFKDYVSGGLIPWIFANVMHDDVRDGSLFYEPEGFLQLAFAKFQLKLMQKMRLYLKAISTHKVEEQVFLLLIKAYDEQLLAQTKKIQKLKEKSLI